MIISKIVTEHIHDIHQQMIRISVMTLKWKYLQAEIGIEGFVRWKANFPNQFLQSLFPQTARKSLGCNYFPWHKQMFRYTKKMTKISVKQNMLISHYRINFDCLWQYFLHQCYFLLLFLAANQGSCSVSL